jgi:hypothetical protein
MDVTASPTTRKLALELGLDIEELAIRLGRNTISQDDLKQKKSCGHPRSYPRCREILGR